MATLLDHGSKLKLQDLRENYFRIADLVVVHCYDSGYPGTEQNRFIDLDCTPEHLREKILTTKVDMEDCISLMGEWGIRAVPTILLFRAGEIVWRHEGVINEGLLMEEITRHF